MAKDIDFFRGDSEGLVEWIDYGLLATPVDGGLLIFVMMYTVDTSLVNSIVFIVVFYLAI